MPHPRGCRRGTLLGGRKTSPSSRALRLAESRNSDDSPADGRDRQLPECQWMCPLSGVGASLPGRKKAPPVAFPSSFLRSGFSGISSFLFAHPLPGLRCLCCARHILPSRGESEIKPACSDSCLMRRGDSFPRRKVQNTNRCVSSFIRLPFTACITRTAAVP